jgi:hypothetical protein
MIVDYVEENNRERARLQDLLDGLTEEKLQRTLPNGWTVAGALAHIAFWDAYAVATLKEWEKNGFSATSSPVHIVNEAVDNMSRIIPLAALPAWVRECAEASDLCAAQVSPELAAAMEAGGKTNFLCRFIHRRLHLDQIDALLRN